MSTLPTWSPGWVFHIPGAWLWLNLMLLRCRLPGGVITTKQWQAIDKFAGENTIYGSIRLTNRQTFQFHGILKKNVKPVHQMLHSVGLDALATANDMNFVAIAENGKLIGFNLLVGGGLSIEHGNKKTYARTASEFGFLPLEHTLAVAEAVVTTQRDWGNRTDRKNAKTKYTLERVGVETFKEEVERRAGIKFEPIRPYEFTGRGDRIGWVKGIDNKWHLTLLDRKSVV